MRQRANGQRTPSGLPPLFRGRRVLLVQFGLPVLFGVAAWVGSHLAQAQAAPVRRASIVGAWLVEIHGAPFVPHVAIFHADGTFLVHNPEAGDPHSSDSLGVGAWKLDQDDSRVIVGQFQEINADRITGQYASRLVVRCMLTMQGANAFSGSAGATYYTPGGRKQNASPSLVTLTGTRIQV